MKPRHKTTPSGMVVPRVEAKSTKTGLQSVILRIARAKREALKALSRQTRVTYSELVRMAIEDLLEKHAKEME